MSDHFCCTVVLYKCEGEYEWTREEFASTIIDLEEMEYLDCDLFDVLKDDEKIKLLPDGDYRITVWGNPWWESNVDWESGLDEGQFMFEFDSNDISIFQMPDVKDVNGHYVL